MTTPAAEVPAAPADPATTAERALRIIVRVASGILASGATTDEVEQVIARMARGLGLAGTQGVVTFLTVQVTVAQTPGRPPLTMLHVVRDRDTDFLRLADLTSLAREVEGGTRDLAWIEAQLDDLARHASPWPRPVAFVAPGASAAAATLMFSGTLADAAAALAIALAVQPALAAVDRWAPLPFFRVGFGAAATAALVAVLVALGAPIAGGLVLTGSLLRFLPGYALVAGFRDLIDQSIVSGTARLAEALLLAAAIAGGTALAGAALRPLGIELTLSLAGTVDRPVLASVLAAAAVVAAFAIRMDVPPLIVPQAALMGALGWLVVAAPTPTALPFDPSATMLLATALIGAAGAILGRRSGRPSALWVVPAVLPLLPGLQLVTAMLAPTDLARLLGLVAAGGTAFLIGAGVATGEILARLARNVRRTVVAPAVEAVTDGVVIGLGAVQRVVGDRVEPREPGDPHDVGHPR